MQPPQFNPSMPPQMQAEQGTTPPAMAPQAGSAPAQETGAEGDDIKQGLEEHLNNISNVQKKFLADALSQYSEVVIPVLGIVNGKEVYDYFIELHDKYFKQQNSAQGATAPQANQGPVMAPSSQPAPPQGGMAPQAKATPAPMA